MTKCGMITTGTVLPEKNEPTLFLLSGVHTIAKKSNPGPKKKGVRVRLGFGLVCTPLSQNIVGSFFWPYPSSFPTVVTPYCVMPSFGLAVVQSRPDEGDPVENGQRLLSVYQEIPTPIITQKCLVWSICGVHWSKARFLCHEIPVEAHCRCWLLLSRCRIFISTSISTWSPWKRLFFQAVSAGTSSR